MDLVFACKDTKILCIFPVGFACLLQNVINGCVFVEIDSKNERKRISFLSD